MLYNVTRSYNDAMTTIPRASKSIILPNKSIRGTGGAVCTGRKSYYSYIKYLQRSRNARNAHAYRKYMRRDAFYSRYNIIAIIIIVISHSSHREKKNYDISSNTILSLTETFTRARARVLQHTALNVSSLSPLPPTTSRQTDRRRERERTLIGNG